MIAQEQGDSAAVIYDAVQSARAKGIDVVLADTAGRLPTQLHLMEEIRKVKRVAAKAQADAPHEILLVLDANTGQNALAQVRAFDDALGLTGLVMTKLDGTAKGGVVVAIRQQVGLPVKYVGVGEKAEDLALFKPADFADALYADLRAAGVSVLYDDRDASPGVKFADADLLGMPVQLVLGAKGLAKGVVERKVRSTGERSELPITGVGGALS